MAIRAIILLGVPGSGKGTMAEAIRNMTSYIHVSTGDMLREEVRKGTVVGREAVKYIEKGDLVPDHLVIKIITDRMDQGGLDSKYLFDGFPRTLPQAELLDADFVLRKACLEHAFLLEVPKELSIQRLTGRRICKKCAANFHIQNMPPKVAGVCDKCGGELYQRVDDMKETILNRLKVFHDQTASLVSYYEKKGILARIDSARQPDMTVAEMMNILCERERGVLNLT